MAELNLPPFRPFFPPGSGHPHPLLPSPDAGSLRTQEPPAPPSALSPNGRPVTFIAEPHFILAAERTAGFADEMFTRLG
jgi:hypothetical protein